MASINIRRTINSAADICCLGSSVVSNSLIIQAGSCNHALKEAGQKWRSITFINTPSCTTITDRRNCIYPSPVTIGLCPFHVGKSFARARISYITYGLSRFVVTFRSRIVQIIGPQSVGDSACRIIPQHATYITSTTHRTHIINILNGTAAIPSHTAYITTRTTHCTSVVHIRDSAALIVPYHTTDIAHTAHRTSVIHIRDSTALIVPYHTTDIILTDNTSTHKSHILNTICLLYIAKQSHIIR